MISNDLAELFASLRDLDIRVWLEDGRLRYSAPKGVLTSAIQETIIAKKKELIEFLSKVEINKSGKHRSILPVSRSKSITLSFAQEQMWLLDQLLPNGSIYNIPITVHIQGELNCLILERCLTELIKRHEVLRTHFVTLDGQPSPVISPTLTIPLPLIDLRPLPDDDRELEAKRLVSEEIRRPFNLAQGPLLRVILLRLGEEDYVMVLVMHHIISDDWSDGVFNRELMALYDAFLAGRPSPLLELPIQYADYAAWQREWLEGEVLEEQLHYWKKQLAGMPPLLELPIAKPRPLKLSYRGEYLPFLLPVELSERLKQLSQKEGCTLYMTLLAAFNVLLYRYTTQGDIVVGTPITGRTHPELEKLVGFFLNTLVMRTQISAHMSFRELMQRVKSTALDAYDHQDLPFEMLVRELRPDRALNHNPLFQIAFILESNPRTPIEVLTLKTSPWRSESKTAKFDLSLFIWDAAQAISGAFEYSTDLFERDVIQRMVGHLLTLLEGIATNPECRISELPILTEQERYQILVEWNNTDIDYHTDKCVHELFEEQEQRTPDAVAVVFEGESLTYRQLNQRANQLAHHLQKCGVGPEKLVGVCLERSIQMIVGILGILKAGGAYVPLDPTYPPERLRYMMTNSETTVLLTQQRMANIFAEGRSNLLSVDDWNKFSGEEVENPCSNASPENLAYLIYTSGSTGNPKAVAMSHRPLTNLLKWQLEETKPGLKTLQFASLSFDVSFQEIASTICSGGTLFLISEASHTNMEELLDFIVDQAIERIFVPFIVLQNLAEFAVARDQSWPCLQEIITAGEQLQITPAIKSWFQRLPGCKLYNHYGPTETHVATAFTLPDSLDECTLLPPIGKPIANVQIYLLDQFLTPVPVGVVGGLYIGGVNLAQGYFKQPGLTAEKFIPNGFSNEEGERLYFTGDLARYLQDGNIEFLGRMDNQVKVRGYRIELGEIESILAQYPGIHENVAAVREDSSGGKRLLAYFIPQPGETIVVNDLREFLRSKVPEYMIPSFFIQLNDIPLTPSGKINRKLLPSPTSGISDTRNEFIAARNETEQMLARIWVDILGLQTVGIHDNFFALGGHSLLAGQVVSRVHKTFGVHLPLRTMFETPTIAEMGQRIEDILLEEIEALPEEEAFHLSRQWSDSPDWTDKGNKNE